MATQTFKNFKIGATLHISPFFPLKFVPSYIFHYFLPSPSLPKWHQLTYFTKIGANLPISPFFPSRKSPAAMPISLLTKLVPAPNSVPAYIFYLFHQP
jgi:hypothetical protein